MRSPHSSNEQRRNRERALRDELGHQASARRPSCRPDHFRRSYRPPGNVVLLRWIMDAELSTDAQSGENAHHRF